MSRSYPLGVMRLTTAQKFLRVAWNVVWLLLYRPSPRPLHAWRRFLLRLFGARIAAGAHPYPGAKIWAPWNLTMAEHSCLASDVDCYCVAPVSLGAYATVSQYSYLCTASHDYRDPAMPLVVAPISIEAEAWVAAAAFVGPGVKIGHGAVVGARSSVFGDVESWAVVAGSPAVQRSTRPSFTRQPGSHASVRQNESFLFPTQMNE
jgi:putative colanic acid biosynthesis acetyltransferase WcaF